jgi:hypothetical protein
MFIANIKAREPLFPMKIGVRSSTGSWLNSDRIQTISANVYSS